MSRPAKFSSVAQYLVSLSAEQAGALKQVLSRVQSAVPRATQVISYNIPAFKGERVFMYCAAFKSHIGIYPPVRDDERLRKALQPYANAKGNLSFALAEPMPYPLIVRVARNLAKRYALKSQARPRAR